MWASNALVSLRSVKLLCAQSWYATLALSEEFPGCADTGLNCVLVLRYRQANSIHSCMQFFLGSGRLCVKVSYLACFFSVCCFPLQAITSRPDSYQFFHTLQAVRWHCMQLEICE